MSSGTRNALLSLPRVLAAVIALGIALTWLWLHDPGERPTAPTSSAASTEHARRDEPASVDTQAEPIGAGATKLRELQALSETFRNTTFLIAIRDAGFVCHDLLDAYGGVDGSATWITTCRDMLAYTLRVTDSGDLAVAPLLLYWDGVTRVRQVDPTTPKSFEPLR